MAGTSFTGLKAIPSLLSRISRSNAIRFLMAPWLRTRQSKVFDDQAANGSSLWLGCLLFDIIILYIAVLLKMRKL